MKQTLLLLLCCASALMYSCKKNNPSTAPEIFLDELEMVGDSVKLHWTILNFDASKEYAVFIGDASWIQSEMVPEGIHYTVPPVENKITYRVMVMASSKGETKTYYSNIRELIRPDINTVEMDPMEALYDADNDQVYLFDAKGTMGIYDIASGQITTHTITKPGFPDMAIHNGQREVYVPKEDGKVEIYNGALEKVDEINVGGPALSVAYINGYLYSTVRESQYLYVNGKPTRYYLKVHNRDSKVQVNNSNDNITYDCGVVKRAGNGNNELVGISYTASYYDVMYDDVALFNFKYTADGNFVSVKRTTPSYTANCMNMVVFQGGGKFATGIGGNVYTKDHTHIVKLGEYPYCTGFGSGNGSLYVGRPNKSLEMYSDATLQKTDSMKTLGYPFRVFHDGNKIICVSKSRFDPFSAGLEGGKCLIEIH